MLVTRLWAEHPKGGGSIRGRSNVNAVETGCGAYLATCSTVTGASLPFDKVNTRNGDHSSLSGPEFNNNSSCLHSPVCLHVWIGTTLFRLVIEYKLHSVNFFCI